METLTCSGRIASSTAPETSVSTVTRPRSQVAVPPEAVPGSSVACPRKRATSGEAGRR